MNTHKIVLFCFLLFVSGNIFAKIDVPPHPDSLKATLDRVINISPNLDKVIESELPVEIKKMRIFDWITKYLPTTNYRGEINNYSIEPTSLNNRIVLKALNTSIFPKLAEVSGRIEPDFYYEYVYLSYTMIIDLSETDYRIRFEQVTYTTNTYCPFRSGKLGSSTSAYWLMGENWRSAPKTLSHDSFIGKYNWYKNVYNDPVSFSKNKRFRDKCLLDAYCESYNELMEYDAAALILNIVYRGITSNLR